METRERNPVNRQEQLLRNKGFWGARGHITEERESEKRNGDNGESRAGQHGLDGGAGGLKGRKDGKIKTGGGEIKINSRDGGWNRGWRRGGIWTVRSG